MKITQPRLRLAIGIATVLGAVGYAAAYVALHEWFGRGDLVAMMTWSLPFAIAVSVLMPALSARIPHARVALAFALCVAGGATVGFAWTLLASIMLGGMIYAFSFPVLLCWIAGGVLGGIIAAWWRHPRQWPTEGKLVFVGVFSLVRVQQWASQPERAIRVVIKPNANEAEVDSVWMDVLGHRTGRGAEHALLPEFSSVGGEPREGASPVLVAEFWSGTSQRVRDRVVAQIMRSPLVLRVDTLPIR